MKTAIFLALLLAPFAIMLFVGTYLLGTYNSLVRGNEVVENSWAQVESQYQRRYDLIPGLVNSTKGILQQEQDVFGAIAEARTRYAGTEPGSDERVEATGQVESALARLLVVVENYPILQSNQTVQSLMFELAGTENRINVARDRYNEQVQVWNTRVKVFPTSLLAGFFGFDEREFFQSQAGSQDAVNVDLSL